MCHKHGWHGGDLCSGWPEDCFGSLWTDLSCAGTIVYSFWWPRELFTKIHGTLHGIVQWSGNTQWHIMYTCECGSLPRGMTWILIHISRWTSCDKYILYCGVDRNKFYCSRRVDTQTNWGPPHRSVKLIGTFVLSVRCLWPIGPGVEAVEGGIPILEGQHSREEVSISLLTSLEEGSLPEHQLYTL